MNEMDLKPTYKKETPPEPPMEWEKYEQLIIEEWNELLKRNPMPNENEIHCFLERYPCMVSGAFNLFGAESGHPPIFCGLISQPILPSFNYRKPDFMWLSKNSDTIEPVLIEIEDPNKQWWTDSGQQTAQLTQALNQIIEWRLWFRDLVNQIKFKEMYGIASDNRQFKPSFLLIYGRRHEANINSNQILKRTELAKEDVDIITFDRLHPNQKACELLCLSVKFDNKCRILTAISVPATFTLGPSFAEDRATVIGLDNAIDSNKNISKMRKEFLIRRLSYWNEWSKSSDRGIITASDRE
jgi:hypothetical protein